MDLYLTSNLGTQQVMQNGRISQAGTFEELLKQNIGFEVLVGAHSKALQSVMTVESSSKTCQDRSKLFFADCSSKPKSRAKLSNRAFSTSKSRPSIFWFDDQ